MFRALSNVRFIKNRPDLVGRAVSNYLRVLGGAARLRSLDLDLTYACPCACAQCYSDNYRVKGAQPLTAEEIAVCVEQAVGLGALLINLTGGEPLLRKDLIEIVAICRNEGALVSMCTSGVELSRAHLSELARAGLGVLIFSIDNITAKAHDANRGVPGLFDRVLDLIAGAHDDGISVIVNSVATQEKLSSGELEQIRQLVLDHGATLNLTIPTPSGRWEEHGDVLLSKEHVVDLFRFLRKPGVRTDTDGRYGGAGCPAGDQKLAIGTYGEVRACQLVPQVFGNVRERPLIDIWRRMQPEDISSCSQRLCPAADADFRRDNPGHFAKLNGSVSGGADKP